MKKKNRYKLYKNYNKITKILFKIWDKKITKENYKDYFKTLNKIYMWLYDIPYPSSSVKEFNVFLVDVEKLQTYLEKKALYYSIEYNEF